MLLSCIILDRFKNRPPKKYYKDNFWSLKERRTQDALGRTIIGYRVD